MAYAQAKQLDSDAIPVIDITPLRDGSDPIGVARQLHAASQGLGFIYISGHGIDPDLIDAARAHAFDFFRTPDADKSAVSVSKSHRGWLKPGAAKMHDGARSDLKESFIWGYESDGEALRDHSLRGPNQWPAFVPQLQASAMAYFAEAHAVAHHLMRGFALGLQLDEQFFLQTCERPLSRASFVYYPAQPAELGEQQFGVAPHTDFGVLTVLCQDDTGGLQVENIDGEWIHAPPIDGTLVVNVGDLLSRWTGGAYKSTPHRVVNTSGRERMSLVLAFDPNPETLIDPTQVVARSADRPGGEPPISCGDYLTWRFDQAFAYRSKA